MTTQTPTAPASEAGKKCKCAKCGATGPTCKRYMNTNPYRDCDRCGHDEACHTTNRADPGP